MKNLEVTETDRNLVAAAEKARSAAYAPMSHFAVGAAVITTDGKIYGGANIENSVYSLTMCAERVAIFSAVAAGENSFSAIAVVADSPTPVSPCGSCRQVMAEFSIGRCVMATIEGKIEAYKLEDLLPAFFDAAAMEKAAN